MLFVGFYFSSLCHEEIYMNLVVWYGSGGWAVDMIQVGHTVMGPQHTWTTYVHKV